VSDIFYLIIIKDKQDKAFYQRLDKLMESYSRATSKEIFNMLYSSLFESTSAVRNESFQNAVQVLLVSWIQFSLFSDLLQQ
jgi:hypothetical protein